MSARRGVRSWTTPPTRTVGRDPSRLTAICATARSAGWDCARRRRASPRIISSMRRAAVRTNAPAATGSSPTGADTSSTATMSPVPGSVIGAAEQSHPWWECTRC